MCGELQMLLCPLLGCISSPGDIYQFITSCLSLYLWGWAPEQGTEFASSCCCSSPGLAVHVVVLCRIDLCWTLYLLFLPRSHSYSLLLLGRLSEGLLHHERMALVRQLLHFVFKTARLNASCTHHLLVFHFIGGWVPYTSTNANVVHCRQSVLQLSISYMLTLKGCFIKISKFSCTTRAESSKGNSSSRILQAEALPFTAAPAYYVTSTTPWEHDL